MCGCVCVVLFVLDMENSTGSSCFSLEDDDCSQLFITQSSNNSNKVIGREDSDEESVFGGSFLGIKGTDFASPNVSVLGMPSCYSDISDPEEDFVLPKHR